MTINDTKPLTLTTEWLKWGISAPAAVFSILYLAAIMVYIAIAGAPFTYPLDDTYIHMALARTIVDSHIWGLSPTEPGAASSSPLWTLILAGFYTVLGGSNFLYVPTALNAALTVLLIIVLSHIFRGKAYSLWLVGSILYAGSILSLSALGMEHVLHALLAIVFCAFASQTLAGPRELETPQRLVGLGVLTALCVTARYESLFLVFSAVAVAVVRRRFAVSLILVFSAAAPLILFGLIWVRNGGWFLPNSLILKRKLAEHNGLAGKIFDLTKNTYSNLKQTAIKGGFGITIFALLGFLIAAARRQGTFAFSFPVVFAICALGATAGHFIFASVGWLYRYESWLIFLDLTAIGLLAESLMKPKWIVLVAVIIVATFTYRTVYSTFDVARAMADRRFEHIAPAEFLDRFYAGKTIMASDVGAVAWLAPTTTVLDIFGLGSNEPVRRLMSPVGYHSDDVSEWAVKSGARIAILEVCSPIADLVPEQWPLVGIMHIPRNVAFQDRIVAFFAIAPGEEAALRRNLQSFAFPESVSLLLIDPPRSEMTKRCWQ